MNTIVFCMAASRLQAETIITQLKMEGFPSQDISILLADTRGTQEFTREQDAPTSSRACAGTGASEILGSIFAWLPNLRALAIPDAGPFIAAGELAGVLGSTDGLARGLTSFGLPEDDAGRFENKLMDGAILISLHSPNREEIDRATEIFNRAGAENIVSTHEMSV